MKNSFLERKLQTELSPTCGPQFGAHTEMARSGRSPLLYSFFRRYSKTTYPIRADIIAMKKFVPVKMSFKANVKLFPGPLEAVNSPIKRLE
jgi:hypothetical protein